MIKHILINLLMMTCLYDISPDCPVIMNFLQGLNLHMTNPDLYQSIPANCCGYGIDLGKAFGEIYFTCTTIGSNLYLTKFQLGYVKINGVLKSQFIPSNLREMYIYNTKLSTTIPNDLPNTIRFLYLYSNKLYGSIPDTLPNQLRELSLFDNLLSVMPKSFPSGITSLQLNNNRFTTFPILTVTLRTLTINNNLIFDKLPKTFPSSLTIIEASNNMIYGPIASLPLGLFELSMNFNQLNGSIVNLPESLIYLKLDFNQLSGNVPNRWPKSLGSINLSHNLLDGSIANVEFDFIYSLDLSWNLFTGNLPKFNSTYYDSVDLSHNHLSGDIDLGYAMIYNMYLSFNQFTNLPISWPRNIVSFGLARNLINGNVTINIPLSISWLDLSGNSITGNIPNISPFEYLNITHNLFTGSIPISLQATNSLDLSYNQLSGCINFQFNGLSFIFNNNYLSGNLSFKRPSQLFIQNNLISDVSIEDDTYLISCDLSNNPMSPGVFGKSFYNYCNLDDVYSSSNTTCGIVPLDFNHTYYIPSKTFNPTTTKLQKTDSKWTTLKNTTQTETQLDTQTVVLQVDVTLVTRISNLFRSYSY
eukprot:NODE_602_length_5512_cov_0.250693.p1 type:complete len:587 gc:universal NODE_602_length_5512_cov_0.250693:1901-141(-)